MTNIIKFPGNISHTNYPTTSTYWIRNAFQPKKRKKRKKTRTHTHALIKLHHEQPSLTHQIPLASWPKSWLASTILPPSSSSPVSISIAKFFVLTLNACDTLGRIVDLSSLPLLPRLMTFVTTASWKVKQIVYARQRNEEYVSPAALKPAVEMNTTPRS